MLHLRPICEDDRAFLSRLYASTRAEELRQLEWSEQVKKSFLASQFEAQQRSYQAHFPGAQFQLILHDDQPAGRLYVDRNNDEIRIIDIALLPEFQREGIGRALLGALLDEARQCGLPIRIHVERLNPAIRFYKQLGFRQIEDQEVYLLMEWTADAAFNS